MCARKARGPAAHTSIGREARSKESETRVARWHPTLLSFSSFLFFSEVAEFMNPSEFLLQK